MKEIEELEELRKQLLHERRVVIKLQDALGEVAEAIGCKSTTEDVLATVKLRMSQADERTKFLLEIGDIVIDREPGFPAIVEAVRKCEEERTLFAIKANADAEVQARMMDQISEANSETNRLTRRIEEYGPVAMHLNAIKAELVDVAIRDYPIENMSGIQWVDRIRSLKWRVRLADEESASAQHDHNCLVERMKKHAITAPDYERTCRAVTDAMYDYRQRNKETPKWLADPAVSGLEYVVRSMGKHILDLERPDREERVIAEAWVALGHGQIRPNETLAVAIAGRLALWREAASTELTPERSISQPSELVDRLTMLVMDRHKHLTKLSEIHGLVMR